MNGALLSNRTRLSDRFHFIYEITGRCLSCVRIVLVRTFPPPTFQFLRFQLTFASVRLSAKHGAYDRQQKQTPRIFRKKEKESTGERWINLGAQCREPFSDVGRRWGYGVGGEGKDTGSSSNASSLVESLPLSLSLFCDFHRLPTLFLASAGHPLLWT